eukprot:GFUD01032458.1.p1 GENE.GFUD01032458.1~~GFUD01032458.1.p1  ORF type:complete len:300 (+),score=64.47 GFUD01032458.1:76-900(+)
MLTEIFTYLELKDLKQALLVCRLWRDLGNDPFLWKEIKLCITIENITEMQMICRLGRLSLIEKIEFKSFPVAPLQEERVCTIFPSTGVQLKLLETVCSVLCDKLTSLQHIDLTDTDLSGLEPAAIAKFVITNVHLKMVNTGLKTKQLQTFFEKMGKGEKKANMKVLDISRNDLGGINPQTLAASVNSLEAISMKGCSLDRKKVETILNQMYQETRLKMMEIGCNDPSSIHTQVLSVCVNKMEQLSGIETHLIKETLETVLTWGIVLKIETRVRR